MHGARRIGQRCWRSSTAQTGSPPSPDAAACSITSGKTPPNPQWPLAPHDAGVLPQRGTRLGRAARPGCARRIGGPGTGSGKAPTRCRPDIIARSCASRLVVPTPWCSANSICPPGPSSPTASSCPRQKVGRPGSTGTRCCCSRPSVTAMRRRPATPARCGYGRAAPIRPKRLSCLRCRPSIWRAGEAMTARRGRLIFVDRPDFFNTVISIGDHTGPRATLDLPTDVWVSWHRGSLVVRPRTAWTVGDVTYQPDTILGIAMGRLPCRRTRFPCPLHARPEAGRAGLLLEWRPSRHLDSRRAAAAFPARHGRRRLGDRALLQACPGWAPSASGRSTPTRTSRNGRLAGDDPDPYRAARAAAS